MESSLKVSQSYLKAWEEMLVTECILINLYQDRE